MISSKDERQFQHHCEQGKNRKKRITPTVCPEPLQSFSFSSFSYSGERERERGLLHFTTVTPQPNLKFKYKI